MSLLDFLYRKEKKEESNNAAPIAHTTAPQTSPAGKNDIEYIRHELTTIAHALRMLNEESDVADSIVDLTIADLFKTLPHLFLSQELPESLRNQKIALEIDDLYEQLAKGKITVLLQRIASVLPQELLNTYAETHPDETVLVPLPLIVSSIRPDQFKNKTASKQKDHGESLLPNLFTVETKSEPTPAPSPPPVEKEKKPVEPIPEPPIELLPPPIEPETAPPEPEPISLTTGKDNTSLIVKGLDINQATEENLTSRLDGVGPTLARQIVHERKTNGLFKDIYDMAFRCHMNPSKFARATGFAWPNVCYRHRDLLAKLVEGLQPMTPDIRVIATRFKEYADIEECIVIHQDGLIISGSEKHETLGAYTPQIFKKLRHSAKHVGWSDSPSITFCMEDKIVTLAHYGVIFLAVIHRPNRFSRKQIEEVQALAFELGQRYTASSKITDAA